MAASPEHKNMPCAQIVLIPNTINTVSLQCSRLDDFIRRSGSQLEQNSFDQASTVWAGMDIVARLVQVGLGPKEFPALQVSTLGGQACPGGPGPIVFWLPQVGKICARLVLLGLKLFCLLRYIVFQACPTLPRT